MRKKGKRSKSSPSTANQNPAASGKSNSPKDVVELVHDLTDEQREEVAQELVAHYRIEQTFIGPLPHPEDFAKYDQVMSGAANRILGMAE